MKLVKRIVAIILVIILLGVMTWITMEVASFFNTTSLTYDGRT